MQPTVFVANDDVVGPLRGGLDKKTQSGGVLGKIEFELRGVGVGGLEGREQWGACRSNRSVLVAGTVQQSHFAWGRKGPPRGGTNPKTGSGAGKFILVAI